jgi:hypothetical protein
VPDAVTVAIKGIGFDELIRAGTDKDRAELIFEIVPYVGRFFDLESILGLGLSVDWKDLSYDKALFFAWIKQGRK